MRVLRANEPAILDMATGNVTATRESLDVQRRQQLAEEAGVARCPRCRCELVPRMGRGRPTFWCRCPVRRVVAA